MDLNKPDSLGNTLLHYSVMRNNCELVEDILCSKDIDLELLNIEDKPSVFYIKTSEMLNIFIDKVGPRIFTVFNSKGHNMLYDETIRKLVSQYRLI